VEAKAADLVERTESSPAQASEEAPALQEESGAESAELRQLQDRKRTLEAELEAKQQQLKGPPFAQHAQSQVDSAAEALKLAEEKATETLRAAEAEKSLVRAIRDDLAADQLKLETAAQAHEQARRQARQQVAEQAGGETAGQAGNETAEQAGSEAAEQAGSEAAEQTTTDPLYDLESQLAAKMRELDALEKKGKAEALVEAQQGKLKEAIRSQQAKAEAARQAEADRAAQASRLASAQAAGKAQSERLQALVHEVSEMQRQLKEVTEQAQQVAEQTVNSMKEPTQPGCYVRSPSACPKKPMKTKWRADSFAVKQGVDKEGCLKRKSMWDKYCGAEDTQMVFVTRSK